MQAPATAAPTPAETADAQTQASAPTLLPPRNEGEEPTVVTHHRIRTSSGWLDYEARVGRLAIRQDETGEIYAYLGFQAFVVPTKPGEKPRPITFAWNGGANSPAMLIQSELLGPKLLRDNKMVENPDTLLAKSDLVFYDPINTGYSRPTRPEYAKKLLTVLGDFAVTTEFIRAYRTLYGAEDQPLFLLGESSGTWRAAGVLDTMSKRKQPIAGLIFISATGGLGAENPRTAGERQAHYIDARTAAAFAHKKLAPDLLKDRDATLREADTWAVKVYAPALDAGVDTLPSAKREELARQLERYTGLPTGTVDRKTLVMSNIDYRKALFGGDPNKVLNMYDMRRFGPFVSSTSPAIGRYLRDELGYRTTLAYTPVEDGFMPKPGPDRRDNFTLWTYDYFPGAQQIYLDNVKKGEGPPRALPWLRDGMIADPGVKVFIAMGRFDSLNNCPDTARAAAAMGPQLSRRVTLQCYDGGHMIYQSSNAVRKQLSADIATFVQSASADATH